MIRRISCLTMKEFWTLWALKLLADLARDLRLELEVDTTRVVELDGSFWAVSKGRIVLHDVKHRACSLLAWILLVSLYSHL